MKNPRLPMICFAPIAFVVLFVAPSIGAQDQGAKDSSSRPFDLERKIQSVQNQAPVQDAARPEAMPDQAKTLPQPGADGRNSSHPGSGAANGEGGFESDLPAQLKSVCRLEVVARIISPQKQTVVIRVSPLQPRADTTTTDVLFSRQGSLNEEVSIPLGNDTLKRNTHLVMKLDEALPDKESVRFTLMPGCTILGKDAGGDRLNVSVFGGSPQRVK